MTMSRKLTLRRANLDEERKRATKFVSGMKLSIDGKRSEEEKKGGLVVIHASYGNLEKRPNFTGMLNEVRSTSSCSSSGSSS